MEKYHAGCASIVDQLIAIREMEQKLIAAFETGDRQGRMWMHLRLTELNRWLDKLDGVLAGYGSAADPPATVIRRRARDCQRGCSIRLRSVAQVSGLDM